MIHRANLPPLTRRDALKKFATGFGMAGFASMASPLAAETVGNPWTPKAPHFAPKAKNVIFLFMEGGPSQIDLFDPKPELQKWHGQPLPASMTKDMRLAFTKPDAAVLTEGIRLLFRQSSDRAWRDHIEAAVAKIHIPD